MLIGYMRVSKADGSQNLDLQKDALLKAGVQEAQIYHDYVQRPTMENRQDRIVGCLAQIKPP